MSSSIIPNLHNMSLSLLQMEHRLLQNTFVGLKDSQFQIMSFGDQGYLV